MIGTVQIGPLRAEAIFARKKFILKNFEKSRWSIVQTAMHRTTFRETASFNIRIQSSIAIASLKPLRITN